MSEIDQIAEGAAREIWHPHYNEAGRTEQITRTKAIINAAIEKSNDILQNLNGCRNRMANAFNMFGLTNDDKFAKEFWAADDDFDRIMSRAAQAKKAEAWLARIGGKNHE